MARALHRLAHRHRHPQIKARPLLHASLRDLKKLAAREENCPHITCPLRSLKEREQINRILKASSIEGEVGPRWRIHDEESIAGLGSDASAEEVREGSHRGVHAAANRRGGR